MDTIEIFLLIGSHIWVAILTFDVACDVGYRRAQQDYCEAMPDEDYYEPLSEDFYDELPF